MPELDIACGEDGGRHVRGDDGETDDEDDLFLSRWFVSNTDFGRETRGVVIYKINIPKIHRRGIASP